MSQKLLKRRVLKKKKLIGENNCFRVPCIHENVEFFTQSQVRQALDRQFHNYYG